MTYYGTPVITDWQKQIIIGTVLGGSSIVKPAKGRNCYLVMRSSNHSWLNFKSQELKNLASQYPFTKEDPTLRWHSNCYPMFNDLHALFYVKNKKTVTMEILDQLRDIGLAIWLGDAGKIHAGAVSINTHKFGKQDSTLISRYFNEVGIENVLTQKRGSHRIKMTTKGTYKFLMITEQYLPDFMLKKFQ